MGRNKVFWMVVPALAASYFWMGGNGADTEEGVNAQAEVSWNNRVWIDEIPTTERQKINWFLGIDDPQIGVFQKTSVYEGDYTLFAWRANAKKAGGVIDIEMLQSGKSHKLTIKTGSKNCGRFDFCMTIKGAPRGAKKYYSMKDWVIEDAGGLTAMTTQARDHVAAAIE